MSATSRTRYGNPKVRVVTSVVHKGRPCHPCILCKACNLSKYAHPKSWKDSDLFDILRRYETSVDIQLDSCICRLCRDDISKLKSSDEGFIPRWRQKKREKESIQCRIPGCNKPLHKVTKVVTRNELHDIFNIVDDFVVSTEEETGTPLCMEHYGIMYRYTNPSKCKCRTCDKRINDITKARSCPEPANIEKYLGENTDFTGAISADDYVCYACYKSHLIILKNRDKNPTSYDPDLLVQINMIKQDMLPLTNITLPEQVLLHAAQLSAVHVGECLLKQTAILLPHVYEMFTSYVRDTASICGIEQHEDIYTYATPKWLRSELSSLLEHHLAYKCPVRKIGTVLYRRGGDLLHALSISLGQNKRQTCTTSTHKNSMDDCIVNACKLLNKKIHTFIDTLTKEDKTQPHDIEKLDIDNFIGKMDQELWRAVCLMTQPLNVQAQVEKVKVNVRKIRQFFCICVLLFTTNNQCSFPLHTLITDVIESCGGSSRLIRILNRLGACVSTDTHARYVQYRNKKIKDDGPMFGYPSNAFTVVSADNLDYIHGHARVYCGKQQSSWHGTTVQIIQPKPLKAQENDIHISTGRVCMTIAEPTTSSSTAGCMDRHQKESVKRPYSICSPSSSPWKRSPLPKKLRRMRTGTEGCSKEFRNQINTVEVQNQNHPDMRKLPDLSIEHFKLSELDKKALAQVKEITIDYMLLKVAAREHENIMLDIQSYFTLYENIQTQECSNIIYFKVLDQKCDDKHTLLKVIGDVYEEFILPKTKKWVILEGDQATYGRLRCLKKEYGTDLDWLIIFPGDWHILKNFQEVLLKVYFDAGLNELAKSSGYNPNAIGGQFKRTHRFILETWEALYQLFMSHFLSQCTPNSFINNLSDWFKSFPVSLAQSSTLRNLKQLFEDASDIFPDFQKHFVTFISTQTSLNESWKFWSQYVFHDCFAYVSLFLAIRSGRWDLRMAAIKSMAPLFSAFDRHNYEKLIPQHIVDIISLPDEIYTELAQGCFTVSLTGRPCHNIAIDESHEMCINKDCKQYVARPSEDYIQRTARFLPVRAKCMKNIEKQLFPEQNKSLHSDSILTIHSEKSENKKFEMNVKSQFSKLKKDGTLKVNNTENGLLHLFNTKTPSPEQVHDLLNFRELGQIRFLCQIEYFILRNPSVSVPRRKKYLLTFSERRERRKRVTQIEKERKLQIECWKKRVEFASYTDTKLPNLFQQCIELPRAIATSEGNPVKGTKSNSTKVYENRYENASPPIMRNSMLSDFIPTSVIMEGMFLINISPLSSHKCLGEYSEFLLKQYILCYFRKGATEVHLLFDDPDCHIQSPKYFERKHRDNTNKLPDDHFCQEFSEDMIIPPKWRSNVLSCRKCKRKLISFLAHNILERIKRKLKPQQRFYTAGGFDGNLQNQALFCSFNEIPTLDYRLSCNAEEADTRVWLHVAKSAGEKKLVISPDTDVYHIGLPLQTETNLHVIVQLSAIASLELRLLDLKALTAAYNNDLDLATIPSPLIPLVMQVLYICTGCDFISFFNGLGKASFLSTFFEYCTFICSNCNKTPGLLSDTDSGMYGFLSFVRLVGSAYFRKHKSAFLPAYNSPMALFNSLEKEGKTVTEHHTTWLSFLRERIWSKIKYEEEMIPSTEALKRHWMRACWVSMVWKQAAVNCILYPPLENYGWNIKDGTLLVDWDSEENVARVKSTVALIKRGCGCKTGCIASRCKCRKGGKYCGPGCKCVRCSNLPIPDLPVRVTEEEEEDSVSESEPGSCTALESDDDSTLDREVDEIMKDVFGDSDDATEGRTDYNTMNF